MLEKKKKIKKLNCYFCVIILICCSCITTYAAEVVNDEDVYYTNSLGLELSEKEYNELLMYVDEQIIDGISVSDYEYIKNNLDTCFASSNVKYVKSTYSKSNDELIQEDDSRIKYRGTQAEHDTEQIISTVNITDADDENKPKC